MLKVSLLFYTHTPPRSLSYYYYIVARQIALILVKQRQQAEAETVLGELYLFGMNQCNRKAFAFLSAAAENGHPRGQYLLGLYYLEIQMYVIAEGLFRKSAEQGYTLAINKLCSQSRLESKKIPV